MLVTALPFLAGVLSQSVHVLPRFCHADVASPMIVTLPLSNIVTDGDWVEIHGRLGINAPLTYVDFPVEVHTVVLAPPVNTACRAVGIDISVPVGVTDNSDVSLIEYGTVQGTFQTRYSKVVDDGPQSGYLTWERERHNSEQTCRAIRRASVTAQSPVAVFFANAADSLHKTSEFVTSVNTSANFASLIQPVRRAVTKRRNAVLGLASAEAAVLVSDPCPLGGWQVPLQGVGDTCTDAATGLTYETVQSSVLQLPAVSSGEVPPGAEVRVTFATEQPDNVARTFRYIPYRLRARCLSPSDPTVGDAMAAQTAGVSADVPTQSTAPTLTFLQGLWRGIRRRATLSPQIVHSLDTGSDANCRRESTGDADWWCASHGECTNAYGWLAVTVAAGGIVALPRELALVHLQFKRRDMRLVLALLIGYAADMIIAFFYASDFTMSIGCTTDQLDRACVDSVVYQVYARVASVCMIVVFLLRGSLDKRLSTSLRDNKAQSVPLLSDRVCKDLQTLLYGRCGFVGSCLQCLCGVRFMAWLLTAGGYGAVLLWTEPADPTGENCGNFAQTKAVVMPAFVVLHVFVMGMSHTIGWFTLGLFAGIYGLAPWLAQLLSLCARKRAVEPSVIAYHTVTQAEH